jgi:hypothetical protein
MIEFKILMSPDKSQQGNYQHFGESLTFGRSEGDMLLDDASLGPAQLKVSWNGSGFEMENLHPKVEVRVNGKPLKDKVPVKERENIVLGRTTLSFSRLDLAPAQPPPPYEHPRASLRFAPDTADSAILYALELQEKAEPGTGTGIAKPAPPPLPKGMPPLPPRKP